MATILPFVVRPAARLRMRPSGESAAIVIFPGVRYERPEDGKAAPPNVASGGRRGRKAKTR